MILATPTRTPASNPTTSPAATISSVAAPTCVLVRPGGEHGGKQGLTYTDGISAETAGAAGLCLHLGTIPPGARGRAHLHEGHESALYILSGRAEMWYGDRLEHHLAAGAGDFLYIPAGVPHLPFNPSPHEPCVAVFSRTDPNDQESVVLRPDLEALRP